ncbi:MAG TPA: ADYC domain-containing protein [Kofleriaceae bacterium]
MRNYFALAVVLAGGCIDAFEDTSTSTQASTYYNGPYVNGPYVNGPYVNGPYVNGPYVNGPYVNGPYVNGPQINGPYVNGPYVNGPHLDGYEITEIYAGAGQMTASTRGGVQLRDAELIGMTIETVVSDDPLSSKDAHVITLRVDDVSRGAGFSLFTISFAIDGTPGSPETYDWQPLCGVNRTTGEPGRAIPDEGFWNYGEGVRGGGARLAESPPGAVTFACEGGAIYKCMDMGYLPWLPSTSTTNPDYAAVDMYDAHQACVRMVRLDLCGDGAPWTVAGTMLHVHDGLGVQADTSSTLPGLWVYEGGWTSRGVEWLSGVRVSQYHGWGGTLLEYLSMASRDDPVRAACQSRLNTFVTSGYIGDVTPGDFEPVNEDCRSDWCLVTKYDKDAASDTEYTLLP